MLLRLQFCLSRGERPFSDRHLLRLRAEGLLQGRRIPFDAFSLSTQLCLFRRDGLSHALYLAADTRRLRIVAVFELCEFELLGFDLFRRRLDVRPLLLDAQVGLARRFLRRRDPALTVCEFAGLGLEGLGLHLKIRLGLAEPFGLHDPLLLEIGLSRSKLWFDSLQSFLL